MIYIILDEEGYVGTLSKKKIPNSMPLTDYPKNLIMNGSYNYKMVNNKLVYEPRTIDN